jgi:hypothetical protein
MPTPTPLPTLADAITAAEQGEADVLNAANQTATDQSVAAALQAKTDAANLVVSTDRTNQSAKEATDVTLLQTLAEVIAARIAALTPVPPATPPAA